MKHSWLSLPLGKHIGGFQHSNTLFACNGFTAITETQYAIKAYLLLPLETCETDEEHIHSVNLFPSVCTASWAGRDKDRQIDPKKPALPLKNVYSIILKCLLMQSPGQDPMKHQTDTVFIQVFTSATNLLSIYAPFSAQGSNFCVQALLTGYCFGEWHSKGPHYLAQDFLSYVLLGNNLIH